MSRPLFSIAFVTAAISLHAIACTTTNDVGTTASDVRPANCQKNECDVAYDQCKKTRTAPVDACAQCNDECNNVSADFIVECLQDCEDICSRPSAPDTYCEDERTSCQKTPKNGFCTDGVDPANLPGDPVMAIAWKPPAKAHAGVCSDAQLAAFAKACGASGTSDACQKFTAATANAGCKTCLLTSAGASAWGPLVAITTPSGTADNVTNDVGCVATIDGDVSENGCGAKIFARDSCNSACWNAKDPNACTAYAATHDCKAEVDAATACYAKLGLDKTGTPYDVCGLEKGDDASLISLTGFFCGQ